MNDDRIPALKTKTAWVVANDADGSLELSTEGAPGAQLMTDDRIPRSRVHAVWLLEQIPCTQKGLCPSCTNI